VADQQPATPVTDDFAPGRRYVVVPDPAPGDVTKGDRPHLVVDDDDRVVAWLPGGLMGGDVVTRAGTWTIAAERVRHGWAVFARNPGDRREVARARPLWLPRAYTIDVPPEGRYRLRGNPITHSWTLRGPAGRVAHLVPGRFYVESIETFDTPLSAPPLALLLALALELDRMETTIPEGQYNRRYSNTDSNANADR
jgi:hypothetical protein